MPIDFMVVESKHKLNKSRIGAGFDPKIHAYFIACQSDFSNYATILNELNDMEDFLLSNDDLNQLIKFCNQIQTLTESVSDYRIYDTWKAFGIKKAELRKFANKFSDLLNYALDNNLQVWSVGE